SQNGSGMSKRTSAKKFVALLQKQSSFQRKSLFSVDEMKSLALKNGISTDKFYDFLGSLNTQGYLLQRIPRPTNYSPRTIETFLVILCLSLTLKINV
ncbi:Minichromosome maintenance complex component 8, partial [Caligus rogercresseyi]